MDIGGLLAQAKHVRKTTGKSVAKQFWEIARLRTGPGKVGPSEYYEYCIYDDERLSWEAKQEFIGYPVELAIECLFNDVEWRSVSNDKLVFYATLAANHLDLPKMIAVYHPKGRTFGDAVQLPTIDATLNFLRVSAPYPMFAKPNRGSFSRGTMSMMSYDSTTDSVLLGDGTTEKLDALFDKNDFSLNQGYLFQELLTPHPKIVEMCGNRLTGIRAIVLLSDDGPKIVRVMCKFPVGNAMTDCFRGRVGNIIGSVDPKTGEILRVVNGIGIDMTEEQCHPDTQKQLVGEFLPDWDKVIDYCDKAARIYSGLRLQHWDISICDRGPVPVEMNLNGGIGVPQYADGAGFMDPEMRSSVEHMQKIRVNGE